MATEAVGTGKLSAAAVASRPEIRHATPSGFNSELKPRKESLLENFFAKQRPRILRLARHKPSL